MVKLADYSTNTSQVTDQNETMEWLGGEDAGWARSMLAAIPSGIFKIFEGAATLGATLLDLGVDRDRADAVEDFFDKINPFDEAAEATAAGKITELIVNLGVPGAPAFRIGSGLAKATLAAQKKGKYLTGLEKLRRYGQGAAATGVTDFALVGNVKEAGSFGDWMGGPTKIDRDSDTPYTELLNRLKFGIEGAAFAGAIGGVGAGIGKIRSQAGSGKAVEGPINKFFEKLSESVRARGKKNPFQKEISDKAKGRHDQDVNLLNQWRDEMDEFSRNLAEQYSKVAVDKVDVLAKQKEILAEMNDVLMSGKGNGQLLNNRSFRLVDEIKIDPQTNFPFRSGFGLLKDRKVGSPLPVGNKGVVKWDTKTGKAVINPKTGKPFTENVKTGNKLYNVTLNQMDPKKQIALRKLLQGKKYKADPKEVDKLFDTFTEGREMIGEFFTAIGRRIDPDIYKEFNKSLRDNINNVVDRGYEVFIRNQGGRFVKGNKQTTVANNYPPVKTALKELFDFYKTTAKQKGYNVSDEVIDRFVRETWEGADLQKGFIRAGNIAPGTVTLRNVPEFIQNSFKSQLVRDKSFIKRADTNLAEVTGVAKPIIQRALGKSNSPINTLVEGITNLSAQVHSGEAFDQMMRRSNELKVDYDAWLRKVKDVGRAAAGKEPPTPFLFDNSGEATKYLGGGGKDIAHISGGGYAAKEIDRFTDPLSPLKGVDDIEKAKIAQMEDTAKKLIVNPIADKWALKPVAESFMKTESWLQGMPAQIYNNLVLYPKGTSQMAKTILAPFTHARNFISATAFAGANGILPFGNTKDVKAAWNALQAWGPGMGKNNDFYRMLLRENVVNSNIRMNQVRDLLKDAKFGEILNNKNSDWALNKLMQRFKKIKKGAEDYYTAEDDFWKIFTFLGEKSRINNAYRNSGLRLGQEFVDMNGVKRLFNDDTLNKLSADLVKNNVPNYAMVSEFIKGLRKFPLGNFVAFPAEIMRTGVNIVETALKEMNYSIVVNGKTVKPLAARGRQRLMGMGITTAAVPLGTVAAAQTAYDISKDEMSAMRRYVADWSKNSTLIPFKDEDGKLSYIDFSHLNAYDTLTRPIMTVLNKVEQGRSDEDGIMDDFILGLIESTKELGEPFISESIWTEALQDVAPILGRDGRDSTGRQIWNPEDSTGNKFAKAMGHLIEAQAPFNWKQMQRLGLSMYPVDSKGRFNERGDEYEFLNEAAGIAGLRRVEIKPERSFNYKITDYKKGIRNSRNLFTAATLKGGPVTPREVVDAYINANRALYGVNREIYEDMQAARVLGMSEDAMSNNMENRGERKAFNSLIEAEFRPLKISKDVKELFDVRSQELGMTNPFEAAEDVMDRIKDVLEAVPLDGDFFPALQNPFATILPDLVSRVTNQLPPLPDPALNTGTQFGNVSPVSGLTVSEEVFLDPLEKRYVAGKRKNQTTNQTMTS